MSRQTLSRSQIWYRDEYLLSPWWQHVRYEVAKRDGVKCSLCGTKKRLEYHHLSYEYRGQDREIDDVVIVCHMHHAFCHYTWFGLKKVPLYRLHLKRRYKRLRRAHWRRIKPSQVFDFIGGFYKV